MWANTALVSHSQYEFTLDFIRIDFKLAAPHDDTGGIKHPAVLVQRVNMSPLFVSELIAALASNMREYEKAFGESVIRSVQEPPDGEEKD